VKDYDRRNFAVHTGLAGILNLSQANFEAMCAIALNLIGDCVLAELHILGKEFKFEQAIPRYGEILDELDRVQVYAFADKTLQNAGEKPRYWVHPGEPSNLIQASGSLENLLRPRPKT
jgi:hypothetical protein